MFVAARDSKLVRQTVEVVDSMCSADMLDDGSVLIN